MVPEKEPEAVLTEEQLAFFTEQTRRAVHKSVRKVVLTAASGYVVLLVGLIIAFGANANTSEQSEANQREARVAIVDSGRAVAVDGCNRDFRNTDKFRGLLVRLKVATTLNAAQPPAQRKAAISFYNTTIADQKYPNCSAARSIITDDPTKPIVVPRPLDVKNPSDASNYDLKAAQERILKLSSGKG